MGMGVRGVPLLSALTVVLCAATVHAKSTESHAPRAAPAHWPGPRAPAHWPGPDAWVYNHAAALREERLHELLRIDGRYVCAIHAPSMRMSADVR